MRAKLAWVLAAITVVLVIADIVVMAAYQSLLGERAVAVHGFPFVEGAVAGCAVLGAVIISKDHRQVIGWLLCVVGFVSSISLLAETYGVWLVSEGGPGSRALGGVSEWVSQLLGGQLSLGALALLFLLAPDGRFLSPGWRIAAWAGLGALACIVGQLTLNPTTYDLLNDNEDDLPLVTGLLLFFGFVTVGLALIASLVSMLIRLRRSQGEQRQQLRLVAAAAGLLTLGLLCLFLVQLFNGGHQTYASSVPLFVAYLLLPVLFSIAILRYRLYDVEVIINRTLVLALGTAFAAVGYTTLVVLVGRRLEGETGGFLLSLLATVVVALAFQPLRRWVVRFANRLAYGSRAQPYQALSDFSGRLAETPSPETLLPAVANAAGRAVSARGAQATMEVSGIVGALSADWGDFPGAGTDVQVVPVRNGEARLGTLEVAIPKGRGARVSDTRLLEAIADQAAVAFGNAAAQARLAGQVSELDRTTRELAASRSRIIEADDTARRTLEESITREVLPHLISVRDRLGGPGAVPGGPEGVATLVADTNTALEALRELTRGVFPTQLVRSGLEPALRSALARLGVSSVLTVDASAAGRRFSPRVEAAAYFCCVEAAREVPDLASIELSITEALLRVQVCGAGVDAVDVRPVTDRAQAAGGWVSAGDGLLTLMIPVGSEDPTDGLAGGRSPGV